MKRFKLGELFCGAGGLAAATRGLRAEGRDGKSYAIEHTWGVDLNPVAIETFNANRLGEGIVADAWQFVRERLDAAHRVDALAFGFPCNSFSMVGEHQGTENAKFGNLYQTGVEVIKAYDPDWFLAENVSGIKSAGQGKHFEKILNDLANAGTYGYDVTAHLYKFEGYGVPQARHRYLIVGIRHDIAQRRKLVFRVPAPTHGPTTPRPFVTCSEAIGGAVAPRPPQGSPATNVEWRLAFTAPGDNAWKLDELLRMDDHALTAYLTALPWYLRDIDPLGDLAAIRAKIAEVKLNCKSARMSHIYRRLDPNRPSYTLTGSGGGGTHVYHWAEHRALTNAERAVLQTFPPDFTFCGTSEEVRRQIGMAVPTEGARPIFAAILKTFARIDYPSAPEEPNDRRVYPKGVKEELKLTSP